MFRKPQPEVLVVGAGPVGLFTALELHEHGVRVRIVDEELRTAAHSYALALHPGTLRLLATRGLAEPAIAQGRVIERVALYDGMERRAEIRLSELPGDFPFLVALRQSAFEQLLEERLHQGGTRVDWNHRIGSLKLGTDCIEATIDRLEKVSSGYAVAATEWTVAKRSMLRPQYVVGTDGHHSFVRRSLGLGYETVRPPLHFAVFEFEADEELPDEVRIVLHEQSLNVLWPLPDRRCRWSFQVRDPEQPTEPRFKSRVAVHLAGASYPLLGESELADLIEERAPWFSAKAREITWSMIVRFESRLATAFGSGRMWLAGDSGHLTGPVGVQSMNVGMREGHDLARRIGDAMHGTGSADGLEEYGVEREEEWRRMLGLDGGLVPSGPDGEWIRRWAPDLLPCIPASGEDLAILARQVGLELAQPQMGISGS